MALGDRMGIKVGDHVRIISCSRAYCIPWEWRGRTLKVVGAVDGDTGSVLVEGIHPMDGMMVSLYVPYGTYRKAKVKGGYLV